MERSINGPEQELLSPEDAAKWMGVPITTLGDWIRHGQVPLPRVINKKVQFYSWEQVYAIRVLLGVGFFPLPPPEKKKPAQRE